MDGDYGVRWTQFKGRDGQLVAKERYFKTQAAMEKFIDKLRDNDNVYRIDAVTAN
jgi:hypothetical protein